MVSKKAVFFLLTDLILVSILINIYSPVSAILINSPSSLIKWKGSQVMLSRPGMVIDGRSTEPAKGRIANPMVYPITQNEPNFPHFQPENEVLAQKQSQSSPGREARMVPAVALDPTAPNKANFPRFGRKNGVSAQKQSQSNPIPSPGVGSSNTACPCALTAGVDFDRVRV